MNLRASSRSASAWTRGCGALLLATHELAPKRRMTAGPPARIATARFRRERVGASPTISGKAPNYPGEG
jgi:hypothetical protein